MIRELNRIAIASSALLPAATASALVVVGGSIDHAEPLWFGWYRSGSGVAIGTHGVLTAAHVGGGSGSVFEMHGERYTVVDRAVIGDDIALLTVDRAMPGYHRIGAAVMPGDEIVIAGTGRYADQPGAWDGRTEAVGTNTVNSTGSYVSFSFTTADIGEAQMTTGDSGAGVFVMGEDGEYELVGIGRAILGPGGQSVEGNLSIATSVTSFAGEFDGAGRLIPAAATAAALPGLCLLGRRRRG